MKSAWLGAQSRFLLSNLEMMIFPAFMFLSFLAHLRVSYCDRSLSVVVCRPSCVNFFFLNIFTSETAHWILTKIHRHDPWVVPYQSCSNGSDWLHK